MPDLRCKCGSKIAEYTDDEVRIMDRKCKTVTVLRFIDGKLTPVNYVVPIELTVKCSVVK